MLKHEKELDVIALRLQNTADLLSAFLDFCDNNGNMDENKSFEDTKIDAWCFLTGLQKQKALVEAAFYIVRRECEIVYSLFDEQEAMVQNAK